MSILVKRAHVVRAAAQAYALARVGLVPPAVLIASGNLVGRGIAASIDFQVGLQDVSWGLDPIAGLVPGHKAPACQIAHEEAACQERQTEQNQAPQASTGFRQHLVFRSLVCPSIRRQYPRQCIVFHCLTVSPVLPVTRGLSRGPRGFWQRKGGKPPGAPG